MFYEKSPKKMASTIVSSYKRVERNSQDYYSIHVNFTRLIVQPTTRTSPVKFKGPLLQCNKATKKNHLNNFQHFITNYFNISSLSMCVQMYTCLMWVYYKVRVLLVLQIYKSVAKH